MTMVLVALPAYNEERYIGAIVSEVKKITDNVIVLDDGSTDGTAEQAGRTGATVHRHYENQGYGVAIRDILRVARDSDPDVLVILDADAQHDPAEIPLLVQAITDGYDLAIGCRSSKDIPRLRRLGGAVLTAFTRLLSGVDVKDSQSGFRAYSRKAITLLTPRERGMAVSSEIVVLAAENELRITEVPVSVRYTRDSSTHNPWKQGFYTLWRLLVMIVRRRLLRI